MRLVQIQFRLDYVVKLKVLHISEIVDTYQSVPSSDYGVPYALINLNLQLLYVQTKKQHTLYIIMG